MGFEDRLGLIKKGDILDNKELVEIFECQHQGGMRKSNKNNCLVLISDNTNPLYKNHWYGNILYYTGMGQKGDQDIYFAQNKTLYESNHNKVRLFLFEVFKKKEYTYAGEVEYLDNYQVEKQLDRDDNIRDVVVFELKVKEDYFVKEDTIEYVMEGLDEKIKKLSTEKLLNIISKLDKDKISKRYIQTLEYDRNPYVREFAKRRAGGRCELCKKEAPFLKKGKEPYLEVHHIEWLSKGGLDSIENTAALCPNCHKKMHVLDDNKDINILRKLRSVDEI